MQKVVIIGCPGTGKTHLSRELAKKTGLPLIHLDFFYHDTRHDYYHNKTAWREKVQELVAAPAWIMEGNYKSTFDVRIPAADTVILLDYPIHIYLFRVFKRRLQYHKRVRPEMPAGWKEKIAPDFLKFVLRYSKFERPQALELLRQYTKNKKVTILHNPKEARNFLANHPQYN